MSNGKTLTKPPASDFKVDKLFRPEISAKRIAALIHMFQKTRDNFLLEKPFQGILDEDSLQVILEDSSSWISLDLESRMITKLSSYGELYNILNQCGRESFVAGAYDLLPSNDRQIQFPEMISRIPILLNRYSRIARLDYTFTGSNSVEWTIDYSGDSAEKWYDVIYFKGVIEGAIILFQISKYKIELLETRLSGIMMDHGELGSNIKFGSDKNKVFLSWEPSNARVGRTNLGEVRNQQEKTFFISTTDEYENEKFSFVDMNTVIAKSRQLVIEKRDLETVVEVLSDLKSQLEKKQKSFTKDLRMARNIQKGIIPQVIPDWKGLQFAVKFAPLQEVSGDYYDYFNFGTSKIGLLVSDVSGHGVPAAFITAISKLLFSNYKLDSPAEIFANANRELLELVKQQGYLTSFYALINSRYEAIYSIAGHPRPVLYRARTKTAEILVGDGTYLGMFSDAIEHYRDYKIQLEPGDKLVIFTDGIVEGENVEGKSFGYECLIDCIYESAEMDANQTADFIFAKHQKFCRGTDQGDDITLIVASLNPNINEFYKHTENYKRYFRNKMYKEASESLVSAHSILPKELGTLFQLGKTFAKNKEYEKAIQYLKEYSGLRTYNADAHLILGYCYYSMEDYENAERELNRSISLRNENIPAMYNLVKTYLQINRKDDAKTLLNKILHIKDDYAPALILEKKLR